MKVDQTNIKSVLAKIDKTELNPVELDIINDGEELIEVLAEAGQTIGQAMENPTMKETFKGLFKVAGILAAKQKETEKKESTPKKPSESPKREKEKPAKQAPKETQIEYVQKLATELAIIRRLVGLHNKPKTYKQTLAVYTAVNRAVASGIVTKNPKAKGGASPWWQDIAWIQDQLHEKLSSKFKTGSIQEVQTLTFDEDRIAKFHATVKSFSVYPSVRLALRFASLQGKKPDKQKVEGLLKAIERAEQNGDLNLAGDKVAGYIPEIKKTLLEFISSLSGRVAMRSAPLNGLCTALAGCGCNRKGNGLGKPTGDAETRRSQIEEFLPLSSLVEDNGNAKVEDFVPVSRFVGDDQQTSRNQNEDQLVDRSAPEPGKYIIPPRRGEGIRVRSDQMQPNPQRRLHFEGRWAELFLTPTIGFSAMIWGLPKSGKSTMVTDFGGYLARNFGKVMYAAIEEGDDETTRLRFERLKSGHSNMEVLDYLPRDLNGWDFVIVDSASDGMLDTHTMRALIKQWPDTSFFFIFHATNDGLPRGGTIYRHIVDVLVEVKDEQATANGRFGPGSMTVRMN